MSKPLCLIHALSVIFFCLEEKTNPVDHSLLFLSMKTTNKLFLLFCFRL